MDNGGKCSPTCQPVTCGGDIYLKRKDLRPRPWPEAAEAEPAFVRRGNPQDIALKKSLWAILSSKMVVLKDLGGTS